MLSGLESSRISQRSSNERSPVGDMLSGFDTSERSKTISRFWRWLCRVWNISSRHGLNSVTRVASVGASLISYWWIRFRKLLSSEKSNTSTQSMPGGSSGISTNQSWQFYSLISVPLHLSRSSTGMIHRFSGQRDTI